MILDLGFGISEKTYEQKDRRHSPSYFNSGFGSPERCAAGEESSAGRFFGGLSAALSHEGFRQGLRELGYVEGKNVVVRIALRRLSPLWGRSDEKYSFYFCHHCGGGSGRDR